ncbi:MAG: hypothetical protein EPN82_17070 [Bacteroidetes bacterium]|nr:MAG: hypothetical protein EPN82_17070 [Bacteroidota bacterium]
MKQIFKFEFYEIKIRKADADLIRDRILSIAKEKNIGTEPIQYEDLLRDIGKKLIELSNTYEFVLDGKKVDLTQDNFAMFKSKVLKTFFHSKLNDDILSILKKNLDILCFYAFDKPWSETEINNKTNELRDVKSKIAVFLLFFKRKNVQRVLLILLFVLLLIYIQYLVSENNTVMKYYETKDKRYQIELEKARDNFFILNKYDLKYYDTLVISDNARVLYIKNFGNDTAKSFPGGIAYQIIRSNINYKSEPGIKLCSKFSSGYAFGFGKTYCEDNCYEDIDKIQYTEHPYKTIFRIYFKDSTLITYVSFKWVEMNGNWGSGGMVYINGNKFGTAPYQYIGIYPPSNMLKDETVRNYKLKVDEYAKYIDIVVLDISNVSEIFINNIVVYGK